MEEPAVSRYQKAILEIIENKCIKSVFQPIVSLKNGSILGHEALSRITCECEIKSPGDLFVFAEQFGCLWELELICRTAALERAFLSTDPPYNKKLFINVNSNIMNDSTFIKGFTRSFLEQYHINPEAVVFEISERSMITDMDGFRNTVEHYTEQGFSIAVDDVGAGFSGLNLISSIGPSYMKLDMNLVRDIDSNKLKKAIVKSMSDLSLSSDMILIAEGIETAEELSALIEIGVPYGQGFYLQKPSPKIKPLPKILIEEIKKLQMKRHTVTSSYESHYPIGELSEAVETVACGVKSSSVYEKMMQMPACLGFVVLDGMIPVGIMTREKLALKMSGNYGFPLYQNKPVSVLMDDQFLSLDIHTPINLVSEIAMSRTLDRLYDFIVVTDCGNYTGIVTIKQLLQKTVEIEVSAAKNMNPLSGLPGNLMIEEHLNRCVSLDKPYTAAYFDIRHFKAYNDVYGFENGDLIIKLLADSMKSNLEEDVFVGHIGGDDFIAIVPYHVEDEYFSNVVNAFEREAMRYYSEEDCRKGYIISKNRNNKLQKFSLATLTCVSINNKEICFRNRFELTEALAKKKKIARSS
ncbi:MAG: GGDEF domain-containing protein [Anaerofustis sp.]